MVGLTNDDPATKDPVFKKYRACGQYGRKVAASAWATVHCVPWSEKFRYVIIQGSHKTAEALSLKEVFVRRGKIDKFKGKVKSLYICIAIEKLTSEALRFGSHSFCKHTIHGFTFGLVWFGLVHQTAPQLTSNSSHLIAEFTSTPRG